MADMKKVYEDRININLYFTYSLQVSEADADSNNSAAGIMDLANLGIRKRVVQLNVDDKKVSVGSEATGKIQSFYLTVLIFAFS